MAMKGTWFQELGYGGMPFLWAYRNWSQRQFDGYYHWHRGFEMLVVHQGRGTVIVNQQTYEIKPGMLFYFQPFQLHKVYAEISDSYPYERSVFHFEPAFIEGYLAAFPILHDMYKRLRQGLVAEQGLDMSGASGELDAACRAFEESRLAGAPSAASEQAAIYALKLLSLMERTALPAREREVKPLRHSERVMAWIERHYGEPFRLESLADELHMSKAYLSRLFRQETGSSITGYLTARRIQQACSLLQTSDQPVEVIAEQVGLGSPSYFIQLFKRFMGVTPHQYRLKL